MANHASAIKAHRQSLQRRSRNKSNVKRLRTGLKKFIALVKAGKLDQASSALPSLYSLVDTAVGKKSLSKNAAARHKSRLTRHLAVALAATNKG